MAPAPAAALAPPPAPDRPRVDTRARAGADPAPAPAPRHARFRPAMHAPHCRTASATIRRFPAVLVHRQPASFPSRPPILWCAKPEPIPTCAPPPMSVPRTSSSTSDDDRRSPRFFAPPVAVAPLNPSSSLANWIAAARHRRPPAAGYRFPDPLTGRTLPWHSLPSAPASNPSSPDFAYKADVDL
ncbi:predicted GPI-anchored protein 58 [Ananas comosus]|uniref:Predicted GPI-anchored protein 58 n=1 Tax=Ananas comosus TaxID=4615 RepID=A0A6P5GKQ2_ANACO|nr:predicted GPI-anchored protein 58 [Ananas comosus]